MKEIGIYLHIPFCKQKCFYCDFISFAKKEEKQKEYVQELKKEIEQNAKEDYLVTTIYIGGGTPSYLPVGEILDLVTTIKQNYTLSEEIEITIEINPGTVTKEKLEEYRKAGVNRLSIGLQETKEELLKEIGRIHTYEEFLGTYHLARKVGFSNINVDLMIGLPNQTIEDIKNSLEKIEKLAPEHISVYSLILEEGTILEQKVENKELSLPDEETERMQYWYVKNKLEEKGYLHYEISNFAKPGKESRHNRNCWEQKEYLGFGVAAHSYFDSVRYSNIENLEEYIQNSKEENKIIQEVQSKEETEKEYMLLGLRKLEGISIQKYKEKFGKNPIYSYRKELQKLVEEGLLEIDLDQIKLTKKGLDFANLVWEEFV